MGAFKGTQGHPRDPEGSQDPCKGTLMIWVKGHRHILGTLAGIPGSLRDTRTSRGPSAGLVPGSRRDTGTTQAPCEGSREMPQPGRGHGGCRCSGNSPQPVSNYARHPSVYRDTGPRHEGTVTSGQPGDLGGPFRSQRPPGPPVAHAARRHRRGRAYRPCPGPEVGGGVGTGVSRPAPLPGPLTAPHGPRPPPRRRRCPAARA